MKSRYRNSHGEPIGRCTQIIECVGYNKRALMMWARKLALHGTDPLKISKGAADAGTLTHSFIESHIYQAPQPDVSQYSFDQIAIAENGLNIYKEWENKLNPEYLESEYCIISESGNWGGTADALCRIDNSIYLIDFKTSKNVYPDHIIQVSAYKHGIEEMSSYDIPTINAIQSINKTVISTQYQCISGVIIIHINKDFEDNAKNIVTPYEISLQQLEYGWDAFQAALTLYKLQDKLKI